MKEIKGKVKQLITQFLYRGKTFTVLFWVGIGREKVGTREREKINKYFS